MKLEIDGFLFDLTPSPNKSNLSRIVLFDLRSDHPSDPLFQEEVSGSSFFDLLSSASYWMSQKVADRDEDKGTFFSQYSARQIAFRDSARCLALRNLSNRFADICDDYPAMKVTA